MTDARSDAARDFLDATDWSGGEALPLAGDASNRRYLRVQSRTGQSAVLMDAPPARGEDTRPFMQIAAWLRDQGLSAPEIYAADTHNGFLLLEDLGDDLFARKVTAEPSLEPELYEAALDVLAHISAAHELPHVDAYDADTMPPLAGLAAAWYVGDANLAGDIEGACREALLALPVSPPTLVLRDYHAENLIWLPGRSGGARVGLLDFQDARLGHVAYDLASLLHDARRDVPQGLQQSLINSFASQIGWKEDALRLACATHGAQRNLRILGVFARLSLHFGKPGYIDLIPRVWRNLAAEVAHPELAQLRQVVASLPPPTPEHLQGLKDRCGTIPTLA